jgi:proteasome lid subunit RPN8/RPN11
VKIRITEIAPKTEKSKLPGKLPRGYPPRLPAVFTSENTESSLVRFACSDNHYELGGVLVGRVAKSTRRLFLQIKDFVPATKGVSRRASFEFTNEAQEEIHQMMQERFKTQRIVGWFHTHPGYGIFLSSADQFIDGNYFNEPFHIAVVIDPTKPEIGVFVWDADHVRIRVPLLRTAGD